MSNNAPGLSEQAKNDGYAALIDIIARLKEESKKEDFQEACDNAPIEPKGRTLLQIVLDDIMANFVTLMQHQPDDKIPKDFYKIMLGTREDREIGDAELDQRLAEALAEKRKPENSRDIKEPGIPEEA